MEECWGVLHKTFMSRLLRHKSQNHDIDHYCDINPLHKTLCHKSRHKFKT